MRLRSGAERARVDAVLLGVQVTEFDDAAMHVYPAIAEHLLRAGTPIGVMDMLIASVALSGGHALLTHNSKHFTSIPGLVVETY